MKVEDIPNITQAEMNNGLKNLEIQFLQCSLDGRKTAKE